MTGKHSEDVPQKLTLAQAGPFILANKEVSASGGIITHLIEITPADIWEQTGQQLFKNIADSSWDTYAVSGGKAVRIGNGFGGFGVTSAVPFDVNKDGTVDLVYAYSFGSGLHRSVIAWLDLKNYTEHTVPDKPSAKEFRAEDLILQANGEEGIGVYRIKGVDKSKISLDVLRTYPAQQDIEHMTLEKEGDLAWENGELLNSTGE
ncbi:hypothetical protein [Paenibacillus sp. S150]|uniref:hypothetical protein n=1 Tax=Paenibacillus sp. S150 TaxID=2749826 RepID=UPI001C57E99D|nr:hypothetical protein [Paenibacillus sp. S150]MBW4081163.1 hypothetical protein [Paenibacillus sp. S150]